MPPEPAASMRSSVHSRSSAAWSPLLEQIEEPAVELLVHPEVARPARLVGEAAGGDHRDALVARIRA